MDGTQQKSSMGMEPNVAAGLGALGGVLGIWFLPLIFFLIEKDSQFVKTHNMQALVLSVLAIALSVVGSMLSVILIGFLLFPLALVVWVFQIIHCIKAFQGQHYVAPLVGKLALKWAGEGTTPPPPAPPVQPPPTV